jgi:hypothetical protein
MENKKTKDYKEHIYKKKNQQYLLIRISDKSIHQKAALQLSKTQLKKFGKKKRPSLKTNMELSYVLLISNDMEMHKVQHLLT